MNTNEVKQWIEDQTNRVVSFVLGKSPILIAIIPRSANQIFNRKVFNPEVLKAMEPIIYDYFKYPSYDECLRELEDIDERLNEIEDKDMLSSEEFNLEDDANLFN